MGISSSSRSSFSFISSVQMELKEIDVVTLLISVALGLIGFVCVLLAVAKPREFKSRRGDDLLRLPDHVLTTKVIPFFGFKDYALTSCASQYLQAHFQKAIRRKTLPLRVPNDCLTLEEAVRRVKHDPRLTTIVMGKGEHPIQGRFLKLVSAINIVGDPNVPKEEVVVVGGIDIHLKKKIQGNVHLEHMIIRQVPGGQAKGNGVFVGEHSSFTIKDVIVENCPARGVVAIGQGAVGLCTNVEVRQCGMSGVLVHYGAKIVLKGQKTKIHQNALLGYPMHYGLSVWGSSATIRLVVPLKKEHVSMCNSGGGNWGGTDFDGNINHIKSCVAPLTRDMLRVLPDHLLTTKVFTLLTFKDFAMASCASQYLQAHWQTSNQRKPLPLYVPDDWRTLEEAVRRVQQDPRIKTIVLGQGEHRIQGRYLEIYSAVNIVGHPDVPIEKIVVLGGIEFKRKIKTCHLQHLTIRHAKDCGVRGYSSFTMDDVVVEWCESYGVVASGRPIFGTCTNLVVRQCERSGILAQRGGSLILMGANTKVHHNCKMGCGVGYGGLVQWSTGSYGENKLFTVVHYGLKVSGCAIATIQLVAPLTKENVSMNNGGGGNWGVYLAKEHQITTVLVGDPTNKATTGVRVPERFFGGV